ncbi:MAG: hemerythrin domain-containing protein [Bacillota bacterium]|nr:hemerythrin domain-containing protein [Bacillota bacterium]
MKPTETLKAEHRVIEQMLDLTEEAARRLAAGHPVTPALFERAADFFRNFADRCHHGKEEALLFVKLVEKGVPQDGGPVGVMLAEHDTGRAHVRAMSAAARRLATGEAAAAREVVEQALGFVALLRAHIQKEDQVLFPLADRILTTGEQAELEQAFDLVETEDMGEGEHERYHGMVHDVRQELRAAAGWRGFVR